MIDFFRKNINFFRKWPVIDLFLFFLVLWFMTSAWKGVVAPENMQKDTERQIALSTIQGASSSCITGVSIILASIAAIIGIARDLVEKAKHHYRIAAVFCIISLLSGIWNMGVLPQLVKHNVAFDVWVAVVLIIQIWMFFFSGIRMLLGICSTIK